MPKDRTRYFRVEARELLEALSRGALDLEKAPADRALVARLLRHAHTLKGAARVVQQVAIADLAHAAEDAIEPFREESAPPVPPDRIDALLRIVDDVQGRVNALEPGAERPAEGPAPAVAPDEALQSVRVDVQDVDGLLASALEAAVQVRALRRQVERLDHAHEVARILSEAVSPRRGGDAEGTGGRARPLADELRRTLVESQRALSARVDEAEREVVQLRALADRLRLVRAGTVFGGLERAARDAARSVGKEVAFAVSGGDVRLDGSVLAAVREAMLHAVRNAVAHGVELPDDRARNGKPRAGRVSVEVERRGPKVVFACRDDGRGIDAAAVRAAAARRGVALPPGSAPPSGEELTRVLLGGGVSTRVSADALSGRGIGLDVVRDVAARLRADVALRTEPGRGTSLELEVPVSITATTALHVEVAGTAYAIPLEGVRETVFVEDAKLARGPDGATLVHGAAALPFAPLAAILGRVEEASGRRTWSTLVIAAGAQALAVGADRLLGTRDVVVRPLPAWIAADATVAGVTLDAQGEPQLVLAPGALVARGALVRSGARPAAGRPRAPILVIDDSLTTRMLEQSILESAGYEVEVAVSGESALEKARARQFGLFVVDIEMPGMDGFEFVRVTRADPRLAAVPAILVTSRSAQEDRQRGMEVGASAYIVKGEFDQNRLLTQIAELLG